MVGANYMGGKRLANFRWLDRGLVDMRCRNAIRFKGKDRDERLQKTFFGKQRLQLLSKGLLSSGIVTDRRGQSEAKTGAGIADISFAHARQKIPVDGAGSSTQERQTMSWIPEPTQVGKGLYSSPLKRFGAHISAPGKARAKILQALDVSEPFALKNILQRIRNTPDLAGLSRLKPAVTTTKQAPSYKADKWTQDQEEMKDQYSDDDYSMQPQSDWSELPSFGDFMDGQDEEQWNQDLGSQSFPARDRSERPFSGYHKMMRTPSPPVFNPEGTPEYGDGEYHFFDNHSDPDRIVATSSSRPYQALSSPPTSAVERSIRLGTKMTGTPSYSPISLEEVSDCQNEELDEDVFDERGLPSYIRLPSPSQPKRPGSVYGTLFLQPDPWSAIGDILGDGMEFPKDSENLGNEVRASERGNRASDWSNSGKGQESATDGEEEENERQEYEEVGAEVGAQELSQEEEHYASEDLEFDEARGSASGPASEGEDYPGIEMLSNSAIDREGPWYDREGPWYDREGPWYDEMFDRRREDRPLSPELVSQLNCPDVDGRESSNHRTHVDYGEQEYAPTPSFEQHMESVLKNCAAEENLLFSSPMPSPNIPSPPTQAIEEQDPEEIVAPFAADGFDEPGESPIVKAQLAPNDRRSLNLLDVPELEEIDGRYVGPSLFDDDMDEEEL
ncbi:hypothetical protein DFP72DRAFT_1166707 [Ephemerocybe angulata]|uniref:Uncharacterized protein n=1 Tax=Ephemerocybe angulata TaxID=980116 RepID=A0A8H6I9Q1_9AGAR|nr:hypothetical protein DFP72DRAFT_1166707 [Tulosesus angulatus]